MENLVYNYSYEFFKHEIKTQKFLLREIIFHLVICTHSSSSGSFFFSSFFLSLFFFFEFFFFFLVLFVRGFSTFADGHTDRQTNRQTSRHFWPSDTPQLNLWQELKLFEFYHNLPELVYHSNIILACVIYKKFKYVLMPNVRNLHLFLNV